MIYDQDLLFTGFNSILFRLFDDENYQKMLRKLVDHAMGVANNCSDTSVDMLVFLVQKECKFSELVLRMNKDDFQLVNSNLSALQCMLDARNDEYRHVEEEPKIDLERRGIEESILLHCLREPEATSLHHAIEMKLETDRYAQKNKEVSKKIQLIYDHDLLLTRFMNLVV